MPKIDSHIDLNHTKLLLCFIVELWPVPLLLFWPRVRVACRPGTVLQPFAWPPPPT